jgi:NAD(P)-dependent dehydrogenase (short-subunit alcohol dehydrogenase family)
VSGRVAGKVAFITGAGRGQGRSHAIRLAEEGADIIAVDVLEDYPTVPYGMSTADDLADTVKAVEALDRRIVSAKADVRDAAALKAALDDGVAQLGKDPNLGPIFMNTYPIEIVEPRDISNAVLFLASDEARYVTGLEFTIDAGNTIR